MKMSQIIKELRQKSGLTQSELGEKLGVKKSAINKYESGKVSNIKRSTIEKMANIFNVYPSYLMGFEDEQKDRLNEDEKYIIKSYRALNEEKQKDIKNFVKFTLLEYKKETKPSVYTFPDLEHSKKHLLVARDEGEWEITDEELQAMIKGGREITSDEELEENNNTDE